MMSKLNTNNKLETILTEHHIDKKRQVYEKLNHDSIPEFPKLDINTIINNITLGTYQLKQSISYIHENFDDNGDKTIEVYSDNSKIITQNYDKDTRLLRTRIQSRHKTNTKYNTYITYSTNKNDTNPVKDWYCTCKNGSRTVGTCSHVASVIYYLSNARYNTTKSGRLSIEKIFPDYTSRESSDSGDNSDATVEYDAEDVAHDILYPDLEQQHHTIYPIIEQQHQTIYPSLKDMQNTD
jgi:hypothetical protein